MLGRSSDTHDLIRDDLAVVADRSSCLSQLLLLAGSGWIGDETEVLRSPCRAAVGSSVLVAADGHAGRGRSGIGDAAGADRDAVLAYHDHAG